MTISKTQTSGIALLALLLICETAGYAVSRDFGDYVTVSTIILAPLSGYMIFNPLSERNFLIFAVAVLIFVFAFIILNWFFVIYFRYDVFGLMKDYEKIYMGNLYVGLIGYGSGLISLAMISYRWIRLEINLKSK